MQFWPCTCQYFIYFALVVQQDRLIAVVGSLTSSPSFFSSPTPFISVAVSIKLQIEQLLREQWDVALAKGN